MKKLVCVLLCALALFILPACGEQASGEETGSDNGGGIAMIANPFVDYPTLDETAAAAGFGLKVPDTVEGYTEKHISVMSGIMLQVIYKNGDDRLFVRKEKGSDDISGDYNVYTDVTSVAVGGRTVTVKGKDGLYSTAVWTDSGFSYAVMADTPMTLEKITSLISSVS